MSATKIVVTVVGAVAVAVVGKYLWNRYTAGTKDPEKLPVDKQEVTLRITHQKDT